MTANGFQSQLSTYASGAALGAAALIAVLGPHLTLAFSVPGRPATACAARVIEAEAYRDRLVSGGSAYAAAKLGPAAVSPTDLVAADAGVAKARAQLDSTCR